MHFEKTEVDMHGHSHSHGDSHSHSHSHHHDVNESNKKRTLIVIVFTLITMAAEIIFGHITSSMALLADGWHMGTHAFALSITYFTYVMISNIKDEKHTHEISERYSALGGYTGAIILLLTSLFIYKESIERFLNPARISFDEAVIVAIIGLVVNLLCMVVINSKNNTDSDYNLRSAYLHITADALTSVLAIISLVLGKIFGWIILDPIMGIVGATLILRWGLGLIKKTYKVLTAAHLHSF